MIDQLERPDDDQAASAEGRLPLIPLGIGAVLIAIGAFAVGWWQGWVQFVGVSVGCGRALTIAVPFVLSARSAAEPSHGRRCAIDAASLEDCHRRERAVRLQA